MGLLKRKTEGKLFTKTNKNIKNESSKTNIVDCYLPIHKLAKLCGYLPFTIKTRNRHTIESEIQWIDWCWLIAFKLICILYSWYYLVQINDVIQSMIDSDAINLGVTVLIIMSLLKFKVSSILDLFNRHRIVGNLQRIIKIDQKV